MTPTTLTVFGVACEGHEVRSAFKGRDPFHVWHGEGSDFGWRIMRRTDRSVEGSTLGHKKWSVTREDLRSRNPKGTGWGSTLDEALEDLERSVASHRKADEKMLAEFGPLVTKFLSDVRASDV